MKPLYSKSLRTIVDPKRFQRIGRSMMFKSRISMPKTNLGDQHYNQWYTFAEIPADLVHVTFIDMALARAFIEKKYSPLTEDEVRAAALDTALVG